MRPSVRPGFVVKNSRRMRARVLAVIPLALLLGASRPETGSGAPLFASPFLSFDTRTAPYSVAISDLNGDGKPDLAVANSGSNTVSVLLGQGDGTFGLKADYGTGV